MKSFKHPSYKESYTMEDKFKEQHELTGKEKEARNIIVFEVEKALTLLLKHYITFGVDNNATHMPINFATRSISEFITAYKNGASRSANQEEVEKIISDLTDNNEVKKDSVNDDLAK